MGGWEGLCVCVCGGGGGISWSSHVPALHLRLPYTCACPTSAPALHLRPPGPSHEPSRTPIAVCAYPPHTHTPLPPPRPSRTCVRAWTTNSATSTSRLPGWTWTGGGDQGG